jgi:hypothetical protein
MRQTRARTAGQAGVPWLSDGWEAYADGIEEVYTERTPTARPGWVVVAPIPGAGLTQTVKQRAGHQVVAVEVRPVFGTTVAQPVPVHIERLNGCCRDRLNCLTRKTHAFAKRAATWDAAVGLCLFEHNWIRPHPALRQPLAVPDAAGRRYRRETPAMRQGLTDHPWTFIEFLTRPVYHGT